MTPDELTTTLTGISGITVTIDTNNTVTIDVGDGIPTITHALSQVVSAEPVAAPDGSHAVRLAIQDITNPDTGVIVYLTTGDVAFAPDTTEASAIVYPNGLLVDIAALPPGISFTEMIRDLNTAPTSTNNYDELTTEILKCVAFWCGARRAGLDVNHLRPRIDALIDHLNSW